MDDYALVTHVLVSRLLWRYAMMSWFISKTNCSFRPTASWQKIPILHTITLLPNEYHHIVGGGLVAFVAMQLSLKAGTYHQPRTNGRWCCRWMSSIIQRATTGLVRKMAVANYEAGKAHMLSKKFAIGASFLEKAILLGHNGARALLAYYLIHGREGLPADPRRASDLASDGADENSIECILFLAGSIAMEVIDTPETQGDSTIISKKWLRKATDPNIKIDDPALAAMLYNLAQGLILSKSFTEHLDPQGMTKDEAHEKALQLLNSGISNSPDCEMKFRLGKLLLNFEHPDNPLRYFTESANQGHPEALVNLGCMYYIGSYVEINKEKGNLLMKRAIEAGSKLPIRLGYI